jgi:hypothetical protein
MESWIVILVAIFLAILPSIAFASLFTIAFALMYLLREQGMVLERHKDRFKDVETSIEKNQEDIQVVCGSLEDHEIENEEAFDGIDAFVKQSEEQHEVYDLAVQVLIDGGLIATGTPTATEEDEDKE